MAMFSRLLGYHYNVHESAADYSLLLAMYNSFISMDTLQEYYLQTYVVYIHALGIQF